MEEVEEKVLRNLIERVMPVLNEQGRRAVLGAAADVIGRRGISKLAKLTGVPYSVIREARKRIQAAVPNAKGRGEQENLMKPFPRGRRPIKVKYPGLEQQLMAMMEGDLASEPDSPITWTASSTRQMTGRLEKQGIKVGYVSIIRLLKDMEFRMYLRTSYSGNMSTDNRENQFRWIGMSIRDMLSRNQPVLMGDLFRERSRTACVHPGRIYELEGVVTVLSEEEFGEFLDNVELWWEGMGRKRFSHADSLLLLLSGSGWDGDRDKEWFPHMRKMVQNMGMDITLSLIPPGTFRLNQIEQVMSNSLDFSWKDGGICSRKWQILQIGGKPDGIAAHTGTGPVGKKSDWWNVTVRCGEVQE